MPVASSWPTTASIPERSRPISAISRSSIRCVTPSWHRLGSKAYSGTDRTHGLIQGYVRDSPRLAEFLPDPDEIQFRYEARAVKSGREVEVDGSLRDLKYLSRYGRP